MTLNTMLYECMNEDVDERMSVDEFRRLMEEGGEANDTVKETVNTEVKETDETDPTYIRWQIFDEIPERIYTIQCDGYVDKNGQPLSDETTIKHLTSGEHVVIDDELEICDKYGNVIDYIDYDTYYYCMDHSKYELREITRQIRTKKFICEAPIGSGKSSAIRKWISAHKTNKFMVIVPTVNIAEEFYTKLCKMNEADEINIRLCVSDNAFKEFHKAVHSQVNVIITTYNTASKCLGDLLEEYYEQHKRLDYFLVIDEAHLLLQHIGLIEITKEFDKVALISATADDIKHFACFKDYIIVNPYIKEKYNRYIYVNKLMTDADEQRDAIVNLIDRKRMYYDKILVKIEDKKECKKLRELLKDKYKVALYTGDDKEVKLNEDGLFETNVDVIISTSSIQNGQSIKENILSIFVQTYIDTVSSVKQFLGRNRNRDSNVVVYVRYGKHMNKRNYSIPNNRYERYLNKLRNNAWNEMT